MQASLDLQLPEEGSGGTRMLRIVVTESYLGAAHDDDEYVNGDYSAEVPSELTDGEAATCALEAFFNSFVVNKPDSFSYAVFDFRTNERLEPNECANWMELTELGIVESIAFKGEPCP